MPEFNYTIILSSGIAGITPSDNSLALFRWFWEFRPKLDPHHHTYYAKEDKMQNVQNSVRICIQSMHTHVH